MNARHVVMVVPDLFFATRIATAAAHLGIELESVAPAGLVETCRTRAPDLVIVDLHGGGDPLGAVLALRASEARGVRVVGFHSHVDAAIREAALEAGVDEVLPRSAFTVRLALLLSRGVGGEPGPGPAR